MKAKNKLGIAFIREALPYMKYNQLFHIIHLIGQNKNNQKEQQENEAIFKIVNDEIHKRDEKYNKKHNIIYNTGGLPCPKK